MPKIFGSFLVLIGSLSLSTAEAGFRSPESLVRNVYAYYGDRSSDLSNGLPRDPATASQFFDPKFAGGLELPEQPALRFSGAKPDMEAWQRLDINPAQAIRQDLCRRGLQQQWPRGHVEFYSGEWARRLGHFRCREPARFPAHVPCAVQKLKASGLSIGAGA